MRSVFILVAALNGLAFNAFAQSTPKALTDFSAAVRNDIARLCLPVQYQNGASAYRDCVQQQITLREQASQADSLDDILSSLSFDERYAIQQFCGDSGNDELAQLCRIDQINELLALPEPRLDDLSSDEQYVMQQTCFNAQSSRGAAAYRDCQLSEILSITDKAAPVYGRISAVDRNALQLQCSASQPSLADYRDCVVNGTSGTSRPSSTAASVVAGSSTTDSQSSNDTLATANAIRVPNGNSDLAETQNVATTEPLSASAVIQPAKDIVTVAQTEAVEPELDAALPGSSTATNTDITLEPIEAIDEANQADAQSATDDSVSAEKSAPVDRVKEVLEQARQFVVTTFNGLSQQGKLLLAALIVAPFVLWLLLSGRRRNTYDNYETRENYNDANYNRDDLKNRVRPHDQFQTHNPEPSRDPISANWEAEADSLFDDPRTEPVTQKIEGGPVPRQDEYHIETYDEALQYEEDLLHKELDAEIRASDETRLEEAPSSGFASWLHSQPPSERLSLSIEFLLYWMAFGDERYDPSLKRRIFQTNDPSSHDIIKRWVLKEDVHAFADVIDWVQQNTTSVQRTQIVRLLMALLINGNTPTPVQNTLLRFFNDVFYLENPTSETIFEQDFGVALPAIPRVDRIAWWQRQTPETVSLWDARTINASNHLTRHAAQLGISAHASPARIEDAYKQALTRCNVERFDHLGEREHQLIESRRSRLIQAYDELVEALA